MGYMPKDLAPMHVVLRQRNIERWDAMKPIAHFVPLAIHIADRIITNRDRYAKASEETKVPWYIIGVIHEREASLSWLANIANGDPWDKKTIHEPSLRGPFKSWDDAAVDALCKCPPYAARWSDASLGGWLALLELYNGLGYANMGLPSPYIWSGTDQYIKGKFVADHHFDPEAIDHQLGCAILLSHIMGRTQDEPRRDQSVASEGSDRTVLSAGDKSPSTVGG